MFKKKSICYLLLVYTKLWNLSTNKTFVHIEYHRGVWLLSGGHYSLRATR